MEMEAFVRKAYKEVGERLGSGFHIEARDVRKNNGVILHGMSVMKEGQNVAPTIYLDTFLEAYESGAEFGAIVDETYTPLGWRRSHQAIDGNLVHLYPTFVQPVQEAFLSI